MNNATVFLFVSLVTMVLSNTAFSAVVGPTVQETKVLEGVIISVTANQRGDREGILATTPPLCSTCKPQEYTFDPSTILLDSNENLLPVSELRNWNEAVAAIIYRKADKHILQIQLFPATRRNR